MVQHVFGILISLFQRALRQFSDILGIQLSSLVRTTAARISRQLQPAPQFRHGHTGLAFRESWALVAADFRASDFVTMAAGPVAPPRLAGGRLRPEMSEQDPAQVRAAPPNYAAVFSTFEAERGRQKRLINWTRLARNCRQGMRRLGLVWALGLGEIVQPRQCSEVEWSGFRGDFSSAQCERRDNGKGRSLFKLRKNWQRRVAKNSPTQHHFNDMRTQSFERKLMIKDAILGKWFLLISCSGLISEKLACLCIQLECNPGMLSKKHW